MVGFFTLLQAGADVFARNAKGQMPMDVAARASSEDCARCVALLFLGKGSKQ